MKNGLALVAILALSGLVMAETPMSPTTAPSTQPATRPVSATDDASYGIGYQAGRQIREAGMKLNVDSIAKGLHDSMDGNPSKITAAEFNDAMMNLQKQAAADAKDAAEKNEKLGTDFRDANGKKKGVITTASGLQIEVITEGTGASPKATDMVKVHYTGTLIDGTKFDSSVDRGQPVTFPLDHVIPAWTEGLQLMKVGGKSRLVCPPNIGYGPAGQGPIPPNATLVFEVELLGIEKP